MKKTRLAAAPSPLERAVVSERIAQLARRRRRGEIDEAVYAASYFLCWQIALHGRHCAARNHRGDPRPDPIGWWRELEGTSGGDSRDRLVWLLQRYGFLNVIANVPAALCAWLRGQWALSLYDTIPKPERVLAMQAGGTRPVTALADSPRLFRPVLTRANAYAFMVHDLEHAYKYFHDPILHRGQRRFFAAIQCMVDNGIVDEYRRDPYFDERFTYLISDMNTHVMHSLQFLRAILIECHLRRERKPPGDRLSAAARREVDDMMSMMYAMVEPLESDGQCRGRPLPAAASPSLMPPQLSL